MEASREFKVTAGELGCLEHIVLRDEQLAGLFESYQGSGEQKVLIRLTLSEAERLRECLTTELAMVGFDGDYRLNEQGQMIEGLIDRFYIS